MVATRHWTMKHLVVGAVCVFAFSACSGTPEEVMVEGSFLYPDGSYSVTETGTCIPNPPFNEFTIRTHSVNPFGSPPSDSVIGEFAQGVMTGDHCRVSYAAGPIEAHTFVTVYIRECGWHAVSEDFADSVEDFPESDTYSRSESDSDSLPVLRVDDFVWEDCLP